MFLLTRVRSLIKVLIYLSKHASVRNGVLELENDHYLIKLGDGVQVKSDRPFQLNAEYVFLNCHPEFEPECLKTQDYQVTEPDQINLESFSVNQ